jgi:hypothetical protein
VVEASAKGDYMEVSAGHSSNAKAHRKSGAKFIVVRKDMFTAANQQAADRVRNTPIATEARYDRGTERVGSVLAAGLS